MIGKPSENRATDGSVSLFSSFQSVAISCHSFSAQQLHAQIKHLFSHGRARMHAQSLQSCPTLCNPMDCSPPGSSVPGISPGKNTGVGCYVLLQGIFLTEGLNLSLLWLLHCRWILYHLATREDPHGPRFYLSSSSNPP